METTDARHALLARLIDHAPMFPPASLAPAEALAEDARAVASPHAFMLARLVWPASRLAELPSYERAHQRRSRRAAARGRAGRGGRDAAVLRSRCGAGRDRADVREVYVETPIDDALEDRLDQLAEHGLRAKVRCGGAEVPSDAELARFVRACRERDLAFKATAGLHHAVRANGEHGFLNLLAAAVFAGDEEAALAETDARTRSRSTRRLRVARPFGLRADELARVRRELFHSIGSCSFFEPVEELEALGMLPP